MRSRLRRLAAVVGAAAVLSVLAAAPAAAHTSLVGVDPVDGSTVATTPAAVVLTFTESAVALGTQIVVTGPQGKVSAGPARLVDRTVRQELVADAPAGRYTVAWRVTSQDGHPLTGEFSFTSTGAGGGTATPDPAPAADATAGAGVPAWGWAVLAAVLLAAVSSAVVLTRRRTAPPSA